MLYKFKSPCFFEGTQYEAGQSYELTPAAAAALGDICEKVSGRAEAENKAIEAAPADKQVKKAKKK